MVFDKVGRCILDGHSDKRKSLICRDEPDDLGAMCLLLVAATVIQRLGVRAVQGQSSDAEMW